MAGGAPGFSDLTIGAFQAANNINATYVPQPPAGGNPYYQARFDGVQGYTNHADNTQTPFAAPQQGGAVTQNPNDTLLGRPPRGAGGVVEGLQRATATSRGCDCHCAGTSGQLCKACVSADAGQIHCDSDQHQQGWYPVRWRARGAQRMAFAVGEAGYGNHRQGNGMPGTMQNLHVYTPGDVAMVPQAAPDGRRRKNRGGKNHSVDEYVGMSSKLAEEWEDPAFSYNGGPPQAGTGGLMQDLQDPAVIQQPLVGPNDLVCRLTCVAIAYSHAPHIQTCDVICLASLCEGMQ